MESILTSIKKLLGITEDYTHFDSDVITHINSAFFTLTQLGVGPSEGFSIKDSSETWDDFLSNANSKNLEAVKSYVYLKVKLLFDPPLTSSVTEAIKSQISEYEWRLNVEADNSKT